MSEREATSASKESILKALNVLNDKNTTNISLSSKIDFLEKKGLSSSDVLDALKLASTTGALNLAGGSSSLKQGWLWTTVAPWVAVVTVGLLTSYFTGDCGDEDSEDGSNNDPLIAAMPSESILGQEVVSSDDVSSTEAIKVDKSDEPEWATKLKEAFVQLTEDVKSLRESAGQSSLSTTQTNGSNSMTNQKPVVTLSEYRSRMHSALLKIRYFCQQRVDQPLSNTIQPMSMSSNTNPHSSSNSIRLTEICGTLLMYLKTALENPNVPRYRRIAIENNHFKTTLGILLSEIGAYGQNGSIVSLCDEYMASIGFVRRGAYYEWLWMRLQKQQNDAPELTTSAPQYRFSSGYTSRHTGKSSLDANQSQNNNNTNNINNTGAQDGINSDLLDRIPDDFVADAIIRECLKLLNDLKNTGNLELMSSESFYKNSNSSSGYISSSSLLPSSSSIFDQSQATNEARAVAVGVFPSVTPSTATVSYSPFPTNLATNATATSNSSMTLPILSSSSETQGLHSVVSDKASGSVAPISFAEVMKLTQANKKSTAINSSSKS